MVLRHAVLDANVSHCDTDADAKGTYCAAELKTTVRALAYEAQNGLVATGLRLELAALLGGHGGWRSCEGDRSTSVWSKQLLGTTLATSGTGGADVREGGMCAVGVYRGRRGRWPPRGDLYIEQGEGRVSSREMWI